MEMNDNWDVIVFKLSGKKTSKKNIEKNSKKIYTFFYKNFSLGYLNNLKQTK